MPRQKEEVATETTTTTAVRDPKPEVSKSEEGDILQTVRVDKHAAVPTRSDGKEIKVALDIDDKLNFSTNTKKAIPLSQLREQIQRSYQEEMNRLKTPEQKERENKLRSRLIQQRKLQNTENAKLEEKKRMLRERKSQLNRALRSPEVLNAQV